MRVFILTGVALALALVGCAYESGSFNSSLQVFPGQRVTLGCLDLAIERRTDLRQGDIVVAYAFGNRCDYPAVVDLARARVIGRTDAGESVLGPYDPHRELAVFRIDGGAVGRESIAYTSIAALRDVCVDAGSIAHTTSTWLCFSSPPPQLSEVL